MAGGRPPIYETPEQLQTAVDIYFSTVEGPITVTGLALSLGFCDRQSLYDYEKNDQFSCIIKTARLKVENSYEKNLSASNPTGSIFALKNMGWKDKTETGFTNNNGEDVAPVQIIQLPANGRDNPFTEPVKE